MAWQRSVAFRMPANKLNLAKLRTFDHIWACLHGSIEQAASHRLLMLQAGTSIAQKGQCSLDGHNTWEQRGDFL